MSGKQGESWSDNTLCGIWSVYMVCFDLSVPKGKYGIKIIMDSKYFDHSQREREDKKLSS